jgi:hypothetical protein
MEFLEWYSHFWPICMLAVYAIALILIVGGNTGRLK